MSIIIKRENGQFNYYQNGELVRENLKVVLDKRKGPGEGDIKLPENSYGRQWLSTTVFKDGITEVDLFNLPKRTRNVDPDKPKIAKNDWTSYLTEDEQKIYDDLKAKCEARATKAQTESTVTALLATLDEDSRKALIASLMGGEA